MTTVIELLRHGEVEGEHVFRGSTDAPLSHTGWQQMESKLETASDAQWDNIISSPLLRCYDFAEALSEKHHLSLFPDERLQEIHFGEWENRTPDGILQNDEELLQRWWNDPTQITPPNGESFQYFRYRVLACWQDLLAAHKGKKLLLLTHAGTIRIILMKILGMQEENLFRLDVGYASLSRIRIHHDETGDWASLMYHG